MVKLTHLLRTRAYRWPTLEKNSRVTPNLKNPASNDLGKNRQPLFVSTIHTHGFLAGTLIYHFSYSPKCHSHELSTVRTTVNNSGEWDFGG